MTKTVESVINITGEQLRAEVIERIKTADESFLRIVHVMLQTMEVEEEENLVLDTGIEESPIPEEAFFEQAAQSVENVKNGGGTPANAFFKKKEAWLKSMK